MVWDGNGKFVNTSDHKVYQTLRHTHHTNRPASQLADGRIGGGVGCWTDETLREKTSGSEKLPHQVHVRCLVGLIG